MVGVIGSAIHSSSCQMSRPARDHDQTVHGDHHGQSGHAAHDKHAGHSVAMFRDKFWISLALTVPTLVWGHMLPRAFGYIAADVPGSRWIARSSGRRCSSTAAWCSSRVPGASCVTDCRG